MQQPSGQRHEDDRLIPDALWPSEDRGSFTHGVCRSCTWVGPGRRSRAGAASDAELHALAGCDIPGRAVAPNSVAPQTIPEGAQISELA
jgi:hypothetical protein